ncbi:hypothetical protein [Blastococcus sp. SYSU DS0539]
MTGHQHGPAVSDAEVRAAAERWARAAGVPLEAAHGSAAHPAPVALRLLRGSLLGAALGVFLLLVARGEAGAAGLWVLLALATGLRVGRITTERRHRVPGRTAPSRG